MSTDTCITSLRSHYDTLVKKAGKHFDGAVASGDPDSVHDLRVAIKRLKAFYNIIAAVVDGYDMKKEFKPFKRIAKKTGRVRDARVQYELTGKIYSGGEDDMSDYTAYLLACEGAYLEKFREYVRRKSPWQRVGKARKRMKKTLAGLSPVWAQTKAEGRFINLKNELVLLQHAGFYAQKDLHDVRKLSKETHYCFEILFSCFDRYTDRPDFADEIKKVHKLLGRWHDCQVGLEYLHAFLASIGRTSADEPYSFYAGKLGEERKSLANAFRPAFKQFSLVASYL